MKQTSDAMTVSRLGKLTHAQTYGRNIVDDK